MWVLGCRLRVVVKFERSRKSRAHITLERRGEKERISDACLNEFRRCTANARAEGGGGKPCANTFQVYNNKHRTKRASSGADVRI